MLGGLEFNNLTTKFLNITCTVIIFGDTRGYLFKRQFYHIHCLTAKLNNIETDVVYKMYTCTGTGVLKERKIYFCTHFKSYTYYYSSTQLLFHRSFLFVDQHFAQFEN